MTDLRIKDLPSLASPTGAELIPTDLSGGATQGLLLSDLRSWLLQRPRYSIDHSNTPYAIPVASETMILVDCSGGSVILNLPAVGLVLEGARVIVKSVTPTGASPGGIFTVRGDIDDTTSASYPFGTTLVANNKNSVIFEMRASFWRVTAEYKYPVASSGGGSHFGGG